MYKIFILLFLYPSLAISSNFTLDKFKIEINSNFLGEEIMLFGQKNGDDKVIIIFEGEKKNARLFRKTKEDFFWINKTKELSEIPSFFAIFSSPKISLSEIFLIPGITKKHYLISNYRQELYEIRTALQNKGLYHEEELDNVDGSLFLKKFKIPDNIPAGNIAITFYEIEEDEVISVSKKNLIIEKRGLTNKLELLLTQQSLFYVFILIIFSIIFSLLSNLIFRKK